MGVRLDHVGRRTAVRPTRRQHAELLHTVADGAAQLNWTPELLDLLLDELDVDDDFNWLRAPGLPKHRYPQVVALALLSRHESRVDDFVNAARRLGLLAPQRRRRMMRRSRTHTAPGQARRG
jgi:hypothetical protein